MVMPATQHRFWRGLAALLVAVFVVWRVARAEGSIGLTSLSLICYWGLFWTLFEIGAASARRLWKTLSAGIVLAVIAPFVSSLAMETSPAASPYGWLGLSGVFFVLALVAAAYRWRECKRVGDA